MSRSSAGKPTGGNTENGVTRGANGLPTGSCVLPFLLGVFFSLFCEINLPSALASLEELSCLASFRSLGSAADTAGLLRGDALTGVLLLPPLRALSRPEFVLLASAAAAAAVFRLSVGLAAAGLSATADEVPDTAPSGLACSLPTLRGLPPLALVRGVDLLEARGVAPRADLGRAASGGMDDPS